jgi:hypothetical protein
LYFTPIVETVHADEQAVIEPVAEVVILEVVYTREDIIRKIEETFPESPNTAVLVAKCESGLIPDIQSNHTLSYGREESFGLFQIHARAWDKHAQRLGYVDYKTEVDDNLKMARYIYEQAGKRWTPWSCYTKGMI